MTTIRVDHSKNYTCISNKAIRDKSLSFRARGLHHLLLSYPDGWTIKTEQLVNESDPDGRDAIATALKELENAGYVTRDRKQNEKTGKLYWESVIRELPITGFSGNGRKPANPNKKRKTKNASITGFTSDGSTSDGSTSDGSTSDGKSGCILNTDLRSTDLRSTDLASTFSKSDRAETSGQNGASLAEPIKPEQTEATTSPVRTEPEQSNGNSDRWVEGHFSAAAPPEIQNSCERYEAQFQLPPWGAQPPEAFLSHIAARHLAIATNYREGGVKPTVHRALNWLKQAYRLPERKDTALALWAEFQEEQARPCPAPQAAAPIAQSGRTAMEAAFIPPSLAAAPETREATIARLAAKARIPGSRTLAVSQAKAAGISLAEIGVESP